MPHIAVRFERFRRSFHEERQDAVLANVFSDVLLCVISSHLCAVVDVLLEDIAQYIGIDVLPACRDARIQMPPPRVEELEQADKGIVLDVYVRIVTL